MMPAMTFHGGKLRVLYYDLREDVSQVFGPYVDELPILNGPVRRSCGTRWTCSWRRRCRGPRRSSRRRGCPTTRAASCRASTWTSGCNSIRRTCRCSGRARRRSWGTTSTWRRRPPFVQAPDGAWVYNLAPSASTVSHAVWTDNRDVRAPADGNWANYTPVTSPALAGDGKSRFDPSQTGPACVAGPGRDAQPEHLYGAGHRRPVRVGARQQQAAVNGVPARLRRRRRERAGAAAQLPPAIENQPTGGGRRRSCSSRGATPLTTLDVTSRRCSSVARTVFVTRADADARIRVSVTEIAAPGGTAPVPGGLTGTVVLNPDPQQPGAAEPVAPEPDAAESADCRTGRPTTRHQRALVGADRCRTRRSRIRTCRTRRFRTRTFRIRRCRTRRSRTRCCRTTRSPTRASSTSGSESQSAESGAAEPDVCRIRRSRTRPAERGHQRHQLGGDQRRQHDRVVYRQPAAQQPGAAGLRDAAAAAQDVHDAGGRRLRRSRSSRTRSCSRTFPIRSSSPTQSSRACRIRPSRTRVCRTRRWRSRPAKRRRSRSASSIRTSSTA